MTTFYTQGARLSGMAALVCAVLAVLSYPGVARADEFDCGGYCDELYDLNDPGEYQLYMVCVAECNIQPPQCPSNVKDGKYINCKNPGKACMNGDKASTCQDGKVECDCPRPKE